MTIPLKQKVVVAETIGGPDVLKYQTDYPVPNIKDGEVLTKNEVLGVNFIDTYFRTGLYNSPKPEVLGREASGTIVALGPNTEEYNFKIGDRVVWLGNAGYAEYSAVPAAKTIKIPDVVSSESAVASFMSGLTSLALVQEAYTVKSGDWVLLHAAAGGTGLLMIQILKARGAKIISTTSSPEKMAMIKGLGVDHAINYRETEGDDWVRQVQNITNGQGVDVVYDSVGKDTWEGSLEVIKRKGTLVSFGSASGPVPPLVLRYEVCWFRFLIIGSANLLS
jgi:NADPH:quinone reductase